MDGQQPLISSIMNGSPNTGVNGSPCLWRMDVTDSSIRISSEANLASFRQYMGAMLAIFQSLPQEDRRTAVSMMRDALRRMQTTVKFQLCNDALKTVAALAESMIQEAYGFTSSNGGDLGLTPSPPAIPISNANCTSSSPINDSLQPSSILDANSLLNGATSNSEFSTDNTDILTNALYATLQAVNSSELSQLSPPHQFEQYPDMKTGSSALSTEIQERRPSNPIAAEHSDHQQPPFGSSVKNSKSNGNRLLKCNQCDYVATYRQNLHRHEKLHELKQMPSDQGRSFGCSFCPKRFFTNSALKDHVAYKHACLSSLVAEANSMMAIEEASNAVAMNWSNNFKCDFCEKVFPMKNALRRHVDMVHLKNRPFQCSECPKVFTDNYHLRRHSQSVHMDLRLHGCPCCGKAFTSAYHLNRHMNSLHK